MADESGHYWRTFGECTSTISTASAASSKNRSCVMSMGCWLSLYMEAVVDGLNILKLCTYVMCI